MKSPKRILIAPLNWGLGHATRCIPIIRELLRQGQEVWIASDGRALELLRHEFPQLPTLELPAYDVRYPRKRLLYFLILQMPKVLLAIVREHRILQGWIDEHRIDAVISDNRLGCFSKKVPCAVISHQLSIFTRPAIVGKVATFLHRLILRRYDSCWIPDLEGPDNLSGDLAHGMKLPNMKYIGLLTRIEPGELPERYDLLTILSGPEPLRSDWEHLILEQVANLPYRVLIVQGKPEKQEHYFPYPHVEVCSFMDSKELNKAILESRVILSRSGYSTIMDLAVLNKKAILVPTPGQPEQEYLALYGYRKGWYYTQLQEDFDLEKGMEEVEKSQGFNFKEAGSGRLEQVLKEWVKSD
ncbi:MAG: glycosyltransferase [Saprospirales bacterium]|nr:glycosyltransferase [Saprospirales bacterium]